MRRLFLRIKDIALESIIRWTEDYRFEPDNKELSPHGKNNYYYTVKWYLSRSSIIKYPKEDLKKIKKITVRPKDRRVDDQALEYVL